MTFNVDTTYYFHHEKYPMYAKYFYDVLMLFNNIIYLDEKKKKKKRIVTHSRLYCLYFCKSQERSVMKFYSLCSVATCGRNDGNVPAGPYVRNAYRGACSEHTNIMQAYFDVSWSFAKLIVEPNGNAAISGGCAPRLGGDQSSTWIREYPSVPRDPG